MKLTSNERLGGLLMVVLLALIAIYLAVEQSGPAPTPPAQQPDTVYIEQPAPPEPKPKKAKTKKAPKSYAPSTPSRSPLDEPF